MRKTIGVLTGVVLMLAAQAFASEIAGMVSNAAKSAEASGMEVLWEYVTPTEGVLIWRNPSTMKGCVVRFSYDGRTVTFNDTWYDVLDDAAVASVKTAYALKEQLWEPSSTLEAGEKWWRSTPEGKKQQQREAREAKEREQQKRNLLMKCSNDKEKVELLTCWLGPMSKGKKAKWLRTVYRLTPRVRKGWFWFTILGRDRGPTQDEFVEHWLPPKKDKKFAEWAVKKKVDRHLYVFPEDFGENRPDLVDALLAREGIVVQEKR